MKEVAHVLMVIREDVVRTAARMNAVTQNRRSGPMAF